MIDPYHQRAGHPARRYPLPPLFSPLIPPSASCFVPILDAFISLANFRFCIILGLCKASRRSWSSLSEFPWLHFTSNSFSSRPVAGYLRLTSCLPLCGVEKGASLFAAVISAIIVIEARSSVRALLSRRCSMLVFD